MKCTLSLPSDAYLKQNTVVWYGSVELTYSRHWNDSAAFLLLSRVIILSYVLSVICWSQHNCAFSPRFLAVFSRILSYGPKGTCNLSNMMHRSGALLLQIFLYGSRSPFGIVSQVEAPVCVHCKSPYVNTLRPRQNGHHFANDTSKFIFMNENVWI